MNLSDKNKLSMHIQITQNDINKFAETTIKELIKIRKDLLNPADEFKISNTYLSFEQALKSGQTQNVAVKSILHKHLKQQTLKGKFIKL